MSPDKRPILKIELIKLYHEIEIIGRNKMEFVQKLKKGGEKYGRRKNTGEFNAN